jgi:Flp pilus assembly protein TadD
MTAEPQAAPAQPPAPEVATVVAAPPPPVAVASAPAKPAPAAPAAPDEARKKLAEEHHRAGRTLLARDRWEEALVELDKALEIDPRLPAVWNARGYALMRSGRYAEAIAAFDKALEIDPSYANARTNREAASRRLKK